MASVRDSPPISPAQPPRRAPARSLARHGGATDRHCVPTTRPRGRHMRVAHTARIARHAHTESRNLCARIAHVPRTARSSWPSWQRPFRTPRPFNVAQRRFMRLAAACCQQPPPALHRLQTPLASASNCPPRRPDFVNDYTPVPALARGRTVRCWPCRPCPALALRPDAASSCLRSPRALWRTSIVRADRGQAPRRECA